MTNHVRPQQQRGPRTILLLLLATVVIWIIASALIARARTGTLSVTIPDADATVSVVQPGIPEKQIGKGNFSIHIQPGSYTVIATSGTERSAKVVQINTRQATSVSLDFEKLVKPSQVAPYRASSLYINDNRLFFVNTESQTPAILRSGDSAAQPYNTRLYPTSRIHWLTPSDVYTLKNRDWLEAKGTSQPVDLIAEEDYPADPESFSVNPSGNYSYISKDRVVEFYSQTDGYKAIASVTGTGSRTSVAADNSVVIFPSSSDGQEAQLYQNGRAVKIGKSMSGAQYATWSPDSKRICFTTAAGIYVYDVATKQTWPAMNIATSSYFSPVWLDNNSVLFAQQNALWRFTADDRQSTKLADIEGNVSSFRPFVIAPDGQNLYFSTSKDSSNKGGAIYRLVPNWNRLTNTEQQAAEQSAIKPVNQTLAATTYSGFEKLTQEGVSTDQLNLTKYAFGNFMSANKLAVKNVSLPNPIRTVSFDPNTSTSTAAFEVKLDNTLVQARLLYRGITTTRLILYDAKGAQIYDSQELKPVTAP